MNSDGRYLFKNVFDIHKTFSTEEKKKNVNTTLYFIFLFEAVYKQEDSIKNDKNKKKW